MIPDFGQDLAVELLRVLQRGPRPLVAILGLNLAKETRNRLDVVVENLRPRFTTICSASRLPLKSGISTSTEQPGWTFADAANDQGKDRGAAVLALIAVDAGDDRMAQFHGLHGLGDAFRLEQIQRPRAPVLDVAEAAGAGADIAHHEEGGGARAPALAHVGAHRLFADGVQCLGAHQPAQPLDPFPAGRAHLDPFRPAQEARRGFLFQVSRGQYDRESVPSFNLNAPSGNRAQAHSIARPTVCPGTDQGARHPPPSLAGPFSQSAGQPAPLLEAAVRPLLSRGQAARPEGSAQAPTSARV